jgi:glycosyltransferase involved in cell wall biosynthesis
MNNHPINVLYLLQYFAIGGKEQIVKDLMISSSEPFNPIACAFRKIGFMGNEVKKAGLEVKLIGSLKQNKNTFNIVRELIDILTKYEIDIVNCHDIGSWYYGVIAGKLIKTKKIVHTRHSFLENQQPRYRFLSKVLSLFTDKIIVVSPEIKHSMINEEHIKEKKIDVIYNGINLEKYQIRSSRQDIRTFLNIEEHAFVTGTVTRFYKVKNIEMQIDMVERLKERIPNLRHLIIGPVDEYGKRIREDIRRKNLEDHISMLGFREDIPEILKVLDIFVLTSFSEGTPLVLFEAMASKCVVVASAVGGIPRLIEHGVNGILFDVHNLEELCRAVLSLYHDPQLVSHLSEAGMKSVEKFSIQGMVKEYENIYLKLLKSSSE